MLGWLVFTPIKTGAVGNKPEITAVSSSADVFFEEHPGLRNDHRFHLLSVDESPFLGRELFQPVQDWEYPLKDSSYDSSVIEPENFAFELDVWRQAPTENVYQDSQSAYLSHIILFVPPSKYKLTQVELKELREAGVPEELIADLEGLQDHEFTNDNDFLAAVEGQLGKEEVEFYQELLLEHAESKEPSAPDGRISEFRLVKHDLQQNIEEWERVLDYPRKVKKTFASPAKKQAPPFPSEQKNGPFFDLLEFLKKLGVPSPFLVFFSVLLLYGLLALWVRKVK